MTPDERQLTKGEIDYRVGKFEVRVKAHADGYSYQVHDYMTNQRHVDPTNGCRTFEEARDKGVAWAEAQLGRLP